MIRVLIEEQDVRGEFLLLAVLMIDPTLFSDESPEVARAIGAEVALAYREGVNKAEPGANG